MDRLDSAWHAVAVAFPVRLAQIGYNRTVRRGNIMPNRLIFKDGDLVRHDRSGEMRQVVGDEFTKRFMDAQDHDMTAHGMGEFAGSYGGAVRTLVITAGHTIAQGQYQTVKASWLRVGYTNLTATQEVV
jgi:hypothetical protein